MQLEKMLLLSLCWIVLKSQVCLYVLGFSKDDLVCRWLVVERSWRGNGPGEFLFLHLADNHFYFFQRKPSEKSSSDQQKW